MFHCKLFITLALSILSFPVFSGTLNYRHEYIDNGVSKDRISVSNTFKNGIAVSLEAKFRSDGKNSQPFSDLLGNGHEEQISWQKKISPSLSFTPAFSIESNEEKSIYKPKIQFKYTFENLSYVAAAYRIEFHKNPSSSLKPDDEVNKYDLFIGYPFGNFKTEFNYTYAKSTKNQIRNNNKVYSAEYNQKISYSLNKFWSPFIEIGNIGIKKNNDRLTRMRIGFAYNF